MTIKTLIQTGGLHKSCKKPPILKNSVILYADKLYNPYSLVKNLEYNESIEKATEIIRTKSRDQLQFLVAKGKNAIICKKNLTIFCRYGRHRSRVVAKLVQKFAPNLVDVIHY